MPTDNELLSAVEQYDTKTEAAYRLGIPRSTLNTRLSKMDKDRPRRPKREKPKLTRDALHQALLPPNTCKVSAFREALDDESRVVLDEALGYSQRDFPASKLYSLLLKIGFPEKETPGTDAIAAHRSGRRPCRCKG